MSESPGTQSVMLTGATGFVGRNVVRELLSRGLTPVCLVRSPDKLFRQHPEVSSDRLVAVPGELGDRSPLREAAEMSQAALHLVGIIIARRLKGQTFRRIHVRGTQNVLEAVQKARIQRYVHMSALGTRRDALSEYQKTKWEAEEEVRRTGLDWTIFRPSLIHGPDGEFMRLMRRFMCSRVPPMIPYFGDGRAKVQPVSVKDVAHCLVDSLYRDDTIGKIFPLCGPKAYTWIDLYNTCRALMPGARHWKPLVSVPGAAGRAAAWLSGPPLALAELIAPSLGVFRFDSGQVQMAQEESTCDSKLAEQAFDIRMRAFEDELGLYAEQID